MEYQTRAHDGEIRQFYTFKDALAYARSNPGVWKISFSLSTNERVRLIKTTDGWTYEDIDGSREV